MNYNVVELEASYGLPNQIPRSNLPEIVFSGRSNVGKSSLINKMLNRKSLARVSARPGKTGTINFYNIDNSVKFVDLPGYGYAKVSDAEKIRWAKLVEGYFNSNREISLVVQIIDMRHLPTKDDLNMINYLAQRGFKFIVVLTKSDKLNKLQRSRSLLNLEKVFEKDIKTLTFSSLTGEGVEDLKLIIESLIRS